MTLALTTAIIFGGSRVSGVSFALGVVAGLAFVLLSKRLRRKEDR